MANERERGPNAQSANQERLIRQAEELDALRKIEHDTAFDSDQRETTGEISTVDQHPADVADFTFQRELQLTTERILEREAEQTRDALRRTASGEYGICSNCGRQISPERLAARPQATLCIECQQRQEGSRPT